MINRRIVTNRGITGLLAMFAMCSSIAYVSAAIAQARAQALPLFQEAAPLQLTLEAPLRALRRSTRTRTEYDGLVRYHDADGREVVLDVEVRVRGNSRLTQCSFAPLRLDFRRSQLEGIVFAGQNRLKLVTPCRFAENYRDYLHLEHDVYRLFNILSEYSFRVRYVEVEYVTTDSRRAEPFTEPAFLIEEDWELAARHDLEVVEQLRLDRQSLDRQHTALLSVFHFVIGNTDWSVLGGSGNDNCCHNGKVIGGTDISPIVVPYDFDQSGLIHTEYARPRDILPIRSVRERLYRGFCEFNDEADRAIDHIISWRSELEAVIAASRAGAEARADALEYLQESLDLLMDPATRRKEIFEACRQ